MNLVSAHYMGKEGWDPIQKNPDDQAVPKFTAIPEKGFILSGKNGQSGTLLAKLTKHPAVVDPDRRNKASFCYQNSKRDLGGTVALCLTGHTGQSIPVRYNVRGRKMEAVKMSTPEFQEWIVRNIGSPFLVIPWLDNCCRRMTESINFPKKKIDDDDE